jgi:hypothetical protein
LPQTYLLNYKFDKGMNSFYNFLRQNISRTEQIDILMSSAENLLEPCFEMIDTIDTVKAIFQSFILYYWKGTLSKVLRF